MSRRLLFGHSRVEDTRRGPDLAHDRAFARHRFFQPLRVGKSLNTLGFHDELEGRFRESSNSWSDRRRRVTLARPGTYSGLKGRSLSLNRVLGLQAAVD